MGFGGFDARYILFSFPWFPSWIMKSKMSNFWKLSTSFTLSLSHRHIHTQNPFNAQTIFPHLHQSPPNEITTEPFCGSPIFSYFSSLMYNPNSKSQCHLFRHSSFCSESCSMWVLFFARYILFFSCWMSNNLHLPSESLIFLLVLLDIYTNTFSSQKPFFPLPHSVPPRLINTNPFVVVTHCFIHHFSKLYKSSFHSCVRYI